MKSRSFLLLFASLCFLTVNAGNLLGQSRGIGAHALVLDDGFGHIVTITIPLMTGPGPYSWTLPITPGGVPITLPMGTLNNTTLYWNGNSWTENTNFLATSAGALTATSINGLTTPLSIAQGGTGTSSVNANLFFAGPTSGSAAAPSFRKLDTSDLPAHSGNYIQNDTSLQANANFNISGNGYLGGNVGIGTTSPITQLEVAGKVPSNRLAFTSTGSDGQAYGVFVSGRYAYIVKRNQNHITVLDVSNPAAPQVIKQVSTGLGSHPTSIYVSGQYAYTTDSATNKIGIFDISNPSSPTKVTNLLDTAKGAPFSIYVSGRYAYYTNYISNALYVVDVSDPTHPKTVGQVSTGAGSQVQSVYVSGNFAYTTNSGSNSLGVYDISRADSPVSAGSVSTGAGSFPDGIYVSGRYAYVTLQHVDSLGIYDISDPDTPIEVGSVWTGTGRGGGHSYPTGIYICGRYAYTANQFADSIGIYDISNPAAPQPVGSVSVGAAKDPFAVYVNGRYAYVANEADGIVGGLATIDLGGEYTQSLETGSLETGQLQIRNDLQAGGEIVARGGVTARTANFGSICVGGSTLGFDSTAIGTQNGILKLSGQTVDIEDGTSGAGLLLNAYSSGSTTIGNSFGTMGMYGSTICFQDAGSMHINDSGSGSTYIGNLNGLFTKGKITLDSGEIDMGDSSIVNLADPINAQDAATKRYVDNRISSSLNDSLNGTAGHLSVFTGPHSIGGGDLTGDVTTAGGTSTTISNSAGNSLVTALNNAATTTNLATTINLSTSGNISTTGAGAMTSAGAITAGSTIIVSTEGDATNGSTSVTVTGGTIFAEVTGTLTGAGTVTVTATPVSGQVIYIHNNTSGGYGLTLGSGTISNGSTGMFIYYGGGWIMLK